MANSEAAVKECMVLENSELQLHSYMSISPLTGQSGRCDQVRDWRSQSKRLQGPLAGTRGEAVPRTPDARLAMTFRVSFGAFGSSVRAHS